MKSMARITWLTLLALVIGMGVSVAQTDEPDSGTTVSPDRPSQPDAGDHPPSEERETEESAPADGMTGAALSALVKQIDPNAEGEGSFWQFAFQDVQLVLVFDEAADRMRIITPIAPQSVLSDELMLRLLQANFDSALDARYGVANEVIWGLFIHPLSPLDQEQLASAIIQVVNVANTFGTTFSSGVLTYGGGDSAEENRKLIEELNKRLNPTT